jgi:hypothetical protein
VAEIGRNAKYGVDPDEPRDEFHDFLFASVHTALPKHGALGSHLETLERNDAYKGFNQTGISQIIRQTDPRTESVAA